ncbi:hypothetical protein LOK49_LG03G02038 [Camellia lanceoleosa]|uniref:Uncharacterized protein n=1 Tax=Camellia lanceoleosa TaxID=1840588 RepID=A0ACC0I993_9ERIC|nr:hypothetical protein LOK49_LG03G02038 [Camellia lanceoleosa]
MISQALLLHPEIPAIFQHDNVVRNTIFFKCTTWQVEETLDPINCPYHYYCDSTYPGNYPPAVDILLLSLVTASYLATLISLVMEMIVYVNGNGAAAVAGRRTNNNNCVGQIIRRCLLPSGPVSLPLTLLALAKGQRINTIFPLSCIGPSILQLIQISALALDNVAEKDMKYALYKASTISGILHASLYLDSTILPYYTGFDALVSSTFSGECISCVCRKQVLVAGGKLVSYRGWSLTTFLVVGTLCFRMICKLSSTQNKGRAILIKFKNMLENLGWIFIAMDCVYLIVNSPPERSLTRVAASSGLFVLICLHVLRKACTWLKQWHSKCEK